MRQTAVKYTEDKAELLLALKETPDAAVILDYTLFDINDTDELSVLTDRFPKSVWLLFSDDLSQDFLRHVIAANPQTGIVLKDCPLHEIREALLSATHGKRYICQRVTELLLAPQTETEKEKTALTPTEKEILKDIAMGMTTKEIADRRCSSFHTVNTHRKNIFRKIGVNNVHEAIRYALRAGLVDSAEYYI